MLDYEIQEYQDERHADEEDDAILRAHCRKVITDAFA